MEEVVANLTSVYPEQAGSDQGLLRAAFGRTHFVYLRRGGVIAQAVSLLRAEQTGVWFEMAHERQEPEGEPSFDFGQVRDRVRLIEDHNAAWGNGSPPPAYSPTWCGTRSLTPSLSALPVAWIDFLGLDLPVGRELAVRHKRLADEINARWIESYRLRETKERRRG